MRNNLIFITVLALMLSSCETGLRVHEPWIRATAHGENGAVYFVLHNHTKQDDVLVDVTTDVADAVEIHQTTLEQGTDIARMRHISSIPIPADTEIIFAPGKYHLMLVNLRKELKVGGQIGIALHFENHEVIVVNVTVRDAAPEEDHAH